MLRSVAFLTAALLGVVSIFVAVRAHSRSPTSARPATNGSIALSGSPRSSRAPAATNAELSVSKPRRLARPVSFAADVPVGIEASSYQDLATFTSNAGEPLRVFMGVGARGVEFSSRFAGESCVGVRTPNVIGLTCGGPLYGDGVIRVQETTFRGAVITSGIAVPAVAHVRITDATGHTITFPVRNGAFLYEGKVRRIEALNAAGGVAGTKVLR